ncbi:MAG: zinc ribbon domain-containing protein [Candidatus Obscuribacterales bacterium]|nr:zinc ribbon domain-containing protein [Candidatus Obscuribacterales bacterium]
MPSYDYRCQSCRKTFTVERSMNASSETNCEYCGTSDVTRIWNMNIQVGSPGSKAREAGQAGGQKGKSKGGGCGSHCGSVGGGCH